ncbi:Hpt domain-containing protein [Methylopila sp. M107]|uniref:Hpt domain-containing protein n=1 Tax=Methylopila sp. M107 TaxID=1101190 RepID=UPI0003762E93|nr:Hpt domain-containing protein [Methylopila sp. M107]
MTPPSADLDRDLAVQRTEFSDHTILRPPNRLKQRAARYVDDKGREDPDPVRRAENALKLLSNEFDAWMSVELEALQIAHGASAAAHDLADLAALYRASHDIRGQAATFGYPLAGMIADGLCELLERRTAPRPAQQMLDLHVNAIKALVRENVRNPDDPVGLALVRRLRELRTEAA